MPPLLPPPPEWRPELTGDARDTKWESMTTTQRTCERRKIDRLAAGGTGRPGVHLSDRVPPPPSEWRPELTGDARMKEWKGMTCSQRGSAKRTISRQKKNPAGPHPIKPPPADFKPETDNSLRMTEWKGMSPVQRQLVKDSSARLNSQSMHSLYCTSSTCPLPSFCRRTPPYHPPIFREYDHIDRKTKKNCVAQLKGAAREAELLKTQVLCLLCHQMVNDGEVDIDPDQLHRVTRAGEDPYDPIGIKSDDEMDLLVEPEEEEEDEVVEPPKKKRKLK